MGFHRPSGPTKWASAARKPEGPGEFASNPSGFGSAVPPVRPSPNPSTLPQIPSGRTTGPDLILLLGPPFERKWRDTRFQRLALKLSVDQLTTTIRALPRPASLTSA